VGQRAQLGASSLPYLSRTTEHVPWPAAVDGGLDSHFDSNAGDWEVTMFPARIPASRQQVQLLDQWLTQTLQELRVAAAAAGCPSVTFGEPDDEDGDGGARDKASALGWSKS
jgi:hypothetical protein